MTDKWKARKYIRIDIAYFSPKITDISTAKVMEIASSDNENTHHEPSDV